MNSESFTYWLKGFVELQDSDSISDKQWLIIKDHLNLVFNKVTPVRGITFQPSPFIHDWKLNTVPLDLIGKATC